MTTAICVVLLIACVIAVALAGFAFNETKTLRGLLLVALGTARQFGKLKSWTAR